MKRTTKRALQISALLTILGILLCTTSLAQVNFDIARLSVPSSSDREEHIQTYNPSEVTRIVIDTTLDSVTLQPSPDEQLYLSCYTGGGYAYDTLVNGTELTIRQRNTGIKGLPTWFQFNLDWKQGRELTLSIPKGYDGDLYLDLDLGEVETVDGIELTGAIDAKLDMGTFSAKTLTARSVTVDCGAGDVTGQSWQISQYTYLTTGSGRVSLKDSTTGGMLMCSTGLGDITLSQISAPDTMLNTGAGSVDFHSLTARHIEVTSGQGSIEGTIMGVEADYSIDAETNLGKCNLKARQGLTDKTLRLTCGAGNIRVEFQS